jgi:peptidoglycan LD-endopeptidase LytH
VHDHAGIILVEPAAFIKHLNAVRKFAILICLTLLLVGLVDAEQLPLPVPVRAGARLITLPVKLALLATRPPDERLIVPVAGVGVRQIGNSWHALRAGGRLHEGQDIFAKRGTAVYSATEGYVVRIGKNRLGGQTVWVMGAGGRSYYYAHLAAYAPGLTVGDYVTPQTVLGAVGTTGNAAGTPPHLHFGTYTSIGAIDPRPLLTDRL